MGVSLAPHHTYTHTHTYIHTHTHMYYHTPVSYFPWIVGVSFPGQAQPSSQAASDTPWPPLAMPWHGYSP